MFFDILTLFPAMFEGAFSDSIIRRATDNELISITIDNMRDYTTDRHRTVDDYPYGGDPGMLLKPEPVSQAIQAARKRHEGKNPKVCFLTPQGRLLDQPLVEELAEEEGLILICGRYKGIDQRVRDKYVDLEISVGDYVLSGGEIPAMVVVDAVTRLLPGALGNRDSAGRDSLSSGLLAPPQYTRPELFEEMRVPAVLLSGHHAEISRWQLHQAEQLTRQRRPELWQRYCQQPPEKGDRPK